jgi:hypothetical protein
MPPSSGVNSPRRCGRKVGGAELGERRPAVSVKATHAYARPGTYFPVLRATSQREGDPKTAFGRVQSLGRARVVVK